jgi:hypothetical protein
MSHKKPKPNSKHFWKVCPSPTSRMRNIICPICGRPKHKRQDCVYCAAVKAWEKQRKRPFPGLASDDHGKATRQLNTMVGVSN